MPTDLWRTRWRRLFLGLTTVTGLSRNGYFIPYRLAASVPLQAERASYDALEAALSSRIGAFERVTRSMLHYLPQLSQSASGTPPAPKLAQDWFPPFDALAAYTMVREVRPRTILEIGGGHSTRVFAQAIADNGRAANLTVVDPQPRSALALLAETGRITLIGSPVQSLASEDIPAFKPGDIVSLDGSHILMPGSDVDVVLNRLLPALPPGVLVHFHDIFLPDPYPQRWAWRGYNEQQGVAALLAGAAAEVVFASRFVLTRLPRLARQGGLKQFPPSRAPASSLWLEWKGYP